MPPVLKLLVFTASLILGACAGPAIKPAPATTNTPLPTPTPAEDSIVRIEATTSNGISVSSGIVTRHGYVIASGIGEDKAVTSVWIIAPDGSRHESAGVASYLVAGRALLLDVRWITNPPPPARLALHVTPPILAATLCRGRNERGQIERQDFEVLATTPFEIKCASNGKLLQNMWYGAPALNPAGEVVGMISAFSWFFSLGGPSLVNAEATHSGIRAESLAAMIPSGHLTSWADWPARRAELEKSMLLCSDAAKLQDSGNLAKSLVAIEQAIDLDSRSAVAWGMKATTLQRLHRWSESIPACRRAAAIHPADAVPHCVLSNDFAELSRFQEALAEANLAIDLNPKQPVTYYAKGWALAGLDRISEAKSAFRRAMNVDPKFQPALDALQRLDNPDYSK